MTTNGDCHRRIPPTPPETPRTPAGQPQYRQRTMMRSDDAADSEARDATSPEETDLTNSEETDLTNSEESPDEFESPESTEDLEASEPTDESEPTEPTDEFQTAEPIDAEESPDPPCTETQTTAESPTRAETPSRAENPATDEEGRLLMPVETLSVLNWLGNIGVEGVESRLDRIPADDVTVETEQVKVDYAGPATVLSQFGVEDRAGARVHLQKPFAGDVLVLFPIKSANRAASLMLQSAVEDAESVVSTPMGRDALTELCNVVANGFVDEWATVFDTPFDTGAPVAVQNPELTLLHRIFSDTDVGLYLTASFQLVEHDVDATIFVFPGEERFVTKISQVDASTIDR